MENLAHHILTNTEEESKLYFELGKNFFIKKNYPEALAYFEKSQGAATPGSLNWETYYLAGESHKKLNHTLPAIESYYRAAQLSDEHRADIETAIEDQLILADPDRLKTWISNRLENRDPAGDYLISFIKNKINTPVTPLSVPKIESPEPPVVDKTSLSSIDAALRKDPSNSEFLFAKIKLLIEKQIDLDTALMLLRDEDYGYLEKHGDEHIQNQLKDVLEQEAGSGNAWFFAAFTGNAIDLPITDLKDWVSRAEELGLENDNEYPLLGLYLLKGEIAEKERDPAAAAQNYFEAGKCYYWLMKYAEAKTWLGKANQLDKTFVATYKYLADCLFMQSGLSLPPYYNIERLDEAEKTWWKAPENSVTDKTDAWYYVCLGRIQHARIKFQKENANLLLWEAVLLTERALIHEEAVNYFEWLGMYYEGLTLYANAQAALDSPTQTEEASDFFKEQQFIVHVNTGNYENAVSYLEEQKKEEQKKNGAYLPWHKSVEAAILFRENQYREAISLCDEVIKDEEFNLLAYEIKLLSLLLLKEMDKAVETAQKLLELQLKYDFAQEAFTFSWGLFVTGNTGEAIDLLKGFCDSRGEYGFDLSSLAIFYLFDGRVDDAKKTFQNYLESNPNIPDLKVTVQHFQILEFLYSRKEQKPEAEAVYATLAECKSSIELAIGSLSPSSPEEELLKRLSTSEFEEGSIPYLAIRFGLARLHKKQHNYTEAKRIYESLLPYSEYYPEAVFALDRLVEIPQEQVNHEEPTEPAVNPIYIDLSENLIPPDAYSPEWYVFTEKIPAMRDRIASKYDILNYRILLRPNSYLTEGNYFISLNEISTFLSHVRPDKMLFIHETEKDWRPLGLEGEYGRNPLNGKDSLWVSKSYRETLDKNGIGYWADIYDYVLADLEITIENNLDMFVDYEFSDHFFFSEREESRSAAPTLQTVTKVLQLLAAEKVPLTQQTAINNAIEKWSHEYSDANEIVQKVRLAIKEDLPGNKIALPGIGLSAETEMKFKENFRKVEGKTFLEIPPAVCSEILEEVRSLFTGNSSAGQLLVADPDLRIHIEKLVKTEFPYVVVTAQEELLTSNYG